MIRKEVFRQYLNGCAKPFKPLGLVNPMIITPTIISLNISAVAWTIFGLTVIAFSIFLVSNLVKGRRSNNYQGVIVIDCVENIEE